MAPNDRNYGGEYVACLEPQRDGDGWDVDVPVGVECAAARNRAAAGSKWRTPVGAATSAVNGIGTSVVGGGPHLVTDQSEMSYTGARFATLRSTQLGATSMRTAVFA